MASLGAAGAPADVDEVVEKDRTRVAIGRVEREVIVGERCMECRRGVKARTVRGRKFEDRIGTS